MVINTILLSDDGVHVCSAGWDSKVILWDIETFSKVCRYIDMTQPMIYSNLIQYAEVRNEC